LSSDKDDLTDITQLPDFDQLEDDQSFASLDDLAKDIGLESVDDPPELPSTSSFSSDDLPSIDDDESPPDFDSTMSDINISSFTESEEDDSDNDSTEETDFSSDDTNFETEETDFGSDDTSFETEDTDFRSDDTSFETEDTDFGSDNTSFEAEDTDFGSDNTSYETEDSDFGSDDTSFEPEDLEEAEEMPRAYEEIESNLTSSTSSELTPVEDLTPPVEVIEKKKTPVESITQTHSTPPEQFEEFKNFAKTMTFSNFSSEGNPPFSIILKNISYVEDVDEIVRILIELEIITSEDTKLTSDMLSRGQLLIPRLSEYAAIYLCHKLRRFDVDILMGLTEEISPPKSYNSNDRGPSSKRTIYSNKKHNFTFDKITQFDEVLATTLSQISNYQVVKYLGVITEVKKLTTSEMRESNIEDQIIEQVDSTQHDELHMAQIKRENIIASESQNKFSYLDFYHNTSKSKSGIKIDSVYQELVSKLKVKAKDSNANGIIGINFSINPISTEEYLKTGPEYQILCTGNMVWIEKN